MLPPGRARKEDSVRIPNRRSEVEPDVSVVRCSIDDYADHHLGAADAALVVEVIPTTAAKDRRLARVYGPGGISAYCIVSVSRRRRALTPIHPAVRSQLLCDWQSRGPPI